MCFSSPKTPEPKAPPPPPTERQGAMDGVRERQQAAARASQSGFDSTIATSPLGVTGDSGAVSKPRLGS